MGVFKQFATNRKAEVEGIRVQYEPNPDGTVPTLILRRIITSSQRYRTIMDRVLKPYNDLIKSDTLPEDIDRALMQRIFVEVAVIGWENWRMPEGVAGGKGEGEAITYAEPLISVEDQRATNSMCFNMDYSIESMLAVLAVMPDLWLDAQFRATDANQFKDGDLVAMAKN